MLNYFRFSGNIGIYSDESLSGLYMMVNHGAITGLSPAGLIILCCSTGTACQSLRSMPLSGQYKGIKKH
jgi:hypothetical protein